MHNTYSEAIALVRKTGDSAECRAATNQGLPCGPELWTRLAAALACWKRWWKAS